MRKVVLVALAVLLPVSAQAAISRVGSCAAQTTSCTFSVAPVSGDAIVVFAHRDGSTTAPTLPTGYRVININGANTNVGLLAVHISDGTETTTSTWTNATSIAAVIYRGANVGPVGIISADGAVGTSITYDALTLDVATGSSWVVGFAAHRTATNVGTAPSGMTLVTSATDIAVSDTNAGVTTYAGASVTVNASSGWSSATVELLATTGEDTTKLYVDDYIDMNTADANGTTITATIFSNGTQGPDNFTDCYQSDTGLPATTSAFTIDAHVSNAPATIHLRNPSTDYAPGSTSKTARFEHSVNHHECRIEGLFSALHRGAVTLAGWVTMGPPDDGGAGNLLGYWQVHTGDGNYCVFQLNNGTGGATTNHYSLNIESNPGGSTVHSSDIVVTPSARYWVVLQCNFQSGVGTLAAYDTSKVQVGSTVTGSLAYTAADQPNGAYFDNIRIGQGDIQTDAGFTTIFEHIVIDYSAAAFPLGPTVSGGGATLHNLLLLGVGL